MTQAPQAPYEQLLALGVSGLELAREGRLAELAACQRARAQLIASLPDVAPAQARTALERSLIIERHLDAELRRARAAVLEALAQVRQGQRAAAGYRPARQRQRIVAAHA